jgi:hypothetical protein
MRFAIYVFAVAIMVAIPQMVLAQTSTVAGATPVNTSTGTPSSFTIKQQILEQQQAQIQREVTEVTRCIRTASLDVVLRDPTGQINRVPQTDLINCRRALSNLQRRLQRLSRAATQLSRDARARSIALETQARLALLQQNLRALASDIFSASVSARLAN